MQLLSQRFPYAEITIPPATRHTRKFDTRRAAHGSSLVMAGLAGRRHRGAGDHRCDQPSVGRSRRRMDVTSVRGGRRPGARYRQKLWITPARTAVSVAARRSRTAWLSRPFMPNCPTVERVTRRAAGRIRPISGQRVGFLPDFPVDARLPACEVSPLIIDRPGRAAPAGLSACGERQYKGQRPRMGNISPIPSENPARVSLYLGF